MRALRHEVRAAWWLVRDYPVHVVVLAVCLLGFALLEVVL